RLQRRREGRRRGAHAGCQDVQLRFVCRPAPRRGGKPNHVGCRRRACPRVVAEPMSPSKARPDSSAMTSDGTVAEHLSTIDTSVLDELLEKRKEEVRIEEFRQRAETMRASVDPAVWQRVADDYAARLARLSAEAGPLKGQARLEYSRLRTVMDRLTAERRAADTEKAELELRHAVGELSDVDLAERLRGSVAVRERCDADAQAVDALRARFVEAFGTEDAIDAPAEPPSDVTNMFTPGDL